MAGYPELILLSRKDCHLCETAAADLRRQGLRFQVSDVDADAELQRLYGDAIPVLLVDGWELARAPIDAASVREEVERIHRGTCS